jgi:nucleoside-diphosphate-sugar epimerase
LVRDDSRDLPTGVERARGDVTRADLGLRPEIARRLAGEVTDVVHAAGDTRFRAAPESLASTNVVGTERVLDFAGRCPRLRGLTFVSTLYVAGLTPGRVLEERSVARAFANEYQRSKREAEDAVLARMPGLPAAIVRSSTWVGDSRDGRTSHPNFVHALIRMLALAPIPIVHVDVAALLDVVATDWAADALAWLHLHASPGGIFHVGAGADAVSVGEALEEVANAQRAAGRREVSLPRIVDEPTYSSFLAEARERGPRLYARILDGLESFLPHFRIRQTFDDRRATAALAGLRRLRPSARDTLRRVVRRCLPDPFASETSRVAV